MSFLKLKKISRCRSS